MTELITTHSGDSGITNLSTETGCGPVRLLPLTGLIDTFQNLYTDLQDCIETNAKSLLRTIVLEPGLKIITDEFECIVLGNLLEIQLGAVVFHDYNLYVPERGINKARLALPDVEEYNEGDVLYVIVSHHTFTDHPYNVIPVDGVVTEADAVQRNSAEITIQSTYTINDLIPAELELISGVWVVHDWRYRYTLKLLKGARRNIPSNFTEVWGDPVSDIVVTTYNLSDLRHTKASVGTDIAVLNTQSHIVHRGACSVINVEWDTPSTDEIHFYGGLAYYKVLLTPIRSTNYIPGSPPVDEAPYPAQSIETIVFYDIYDNQERMGTSIPVTPHVIYKIIIYRLNDNLEQIATSSSDALYCIAGMTSQTCYECSLIADFYASITPIGNPNTIKIHIENVISNQENIILQVFISDYETWPGSGPSSTSLTQKKFLYYEGPVRDVFYCIRDGIDGAFIYPRLVCREGNIVIDSWGSGQVYAYRARNVESENIVTPFEIPLVISGNNIDMPPGGPGSGAGGYARLTADDAMWTIAERDFYISRMIATTPQGVDNTLGASAANEGLWYPETYDPLNVSYVGDGGTLRIYVDNVLQADINYDTTGCCYKVFAQPIHVPAGARLRVDVGATAPTESYPFCMNVILYTFGTWRQV